MAKKKKRSLGRLLLAGPTLGLSLRGTKGGKRGKLKSEPGFVTEARQNIRNLMTPEGFAESLRKNLETLQGQYAPFFNTQRKLALDQVQQRAIAGQPASLVGMSGPEVLGLRNTTDAQLAQQQALLTNLALGNIQTELGNAGIVLGSTPPGYTSQVDVLNQLGGLAGDLVKKLIPSRFSLAGVP